MSSKQLKEDKKTSKSVRITSRCMAIVLKPHQSYSEPEQHDRGPKQHGSEVFENFRKQNFDCHWNPVLEETFKNITFVGWLQPYTLLVGGEDVYLENLRQAWIRRMLKAPAEHTVLALGEIEGISMLPVLQTQFTPLPESICIAVSALNQTNIKATLESVRDKLRLSYEDVQLPPDQIIYDTLGTLIRERKLYHTGDGYFIVTPETYKFPSEHKQFPLSITIQDHELTLVEEDLEKLIPLLTPTKQPVKSKSSQTAFEKEEKKQHHRLLRSQSLKAQSKSKKENSFERSASLRYNEDKVKDVWKEMNNKNTLNNSKEKDKTEKISLLSRLWNKWKTKKPNPQESPKEVEYATFSAQFPPPEWKWYKQHLSVKDTRPETLGSPRQMTKAQTWHHLQSVSKDTCESSPRAVTSKKMPDKEYLKLNSLQLNSPLGFNDPRFERFLLEYAKTEKTSPASPKQGTKESKHKKHYGKIGNYDNITDYPQKVEPVRQHSIEKSESPSGERQQMLYNGAQLTESRQEPIGSHSNDSDSPNDSREVSGESFDHSTPIPGRRSHGQNRHCERQRENNSTTNKFDVRDDPNPGIHSKSNRHAWPHEPRFPPMTASNTEHIENSKKMYYTSFSNEISHHYVGKLPNKDGVYAASKDSGVNCVGLPTLPEKSHMPYRFPGDYDNLENYPMNNDFDRNHKKRSQKMEDNYMTAQQIDACRIGNGKKKQNNEFKNGISNGSKSSQHVLHNGFTSVYSNGNGHSALQDPKRSTPSPTYLGTTTISNQQLTSFEKEHKFPVLKSNDKVYSNIHNGHISNRPPCRVRETCVDGDLTGSDQSGTSHGKNQNGKKRVHFEDLKVVGVL